jgi:hypothetical protein
MTGTNSGVGIGGLDMGGGLPPEVLGPGVPPPLQQHHHHQQSIEQQSQHQHQLLQLHQPEEAHMRLPTGMLEPEQPTQVVVEGAVADHGAAMAASVVGDGGIAVLGEELMSQPLDTGSDSLKKAEDVQAAALAAAVEAVSSSVGGLERSIDAADEEQKKGVRGTGKRQMRSKARVHKCLVDGCEFAAARTGDLAAHMRVHTREKPFKCEHEGCSYAAAQPATLTAHRRTHTGEKRFRCDYPGCLFRSAKAGNLTVHKRLHSGEKPFKCTHAACDYATTKSSSLARHEMIHTGHKPHKCEYPDCQFAAVKSSDLKRHVRIHTGEKIKCSYPGCGFEAAGLNTVSNHQRQKHAPAEWAALAGGLEAAPISTSHVPGQGALIQGVTTAMAAVASEAADDDTITFPIHGPIPVMAEPTDMGEAASKRAKLDSGHEAGTQADIMEAPGATEPELSAMFPAVTFLNPQAAAAKAMASSGAVTSSHATV